MLWVIRLVKINPDIDCEQSIQILNDLRNIMARHYRIKTTIKSPTTLEDSLFNNAYIGILYYPTSS